MADSNGQIVAGSRIAGIEQTSPDEATCAGGPSDFDDIRSTLDGDGTAYARLMERHQGRVAARMWRFTRDRAEHSELVQEVFVQAYLSLSNYRADGPFPNWLSGIGTVVGYKHWKKKARDRTIFQQLPDNLEALATQDPDSVDPSEAAQAIFAMLGKLKPRDRVVLTLRFVEDRTVEETARHLGWSETMVKVQTWRARNKLRKLLESAGVEVSP